MSRSTHADSRCHSRSPSAPSARVDVLVLDNDSQARASLTSWLQDRDLDVRGAGSLAEAQRIVAERLPELAVLGNDLPDGAAVELLEDLAPAGVEIVMARARTSTNGTTAAPRTSDSGSRPLPVDIPELGAVVEKARRRAQRPTENHTAQPEQRVAFGTMIGGSTVMQDVYRCIEQVASTDETVFLTGPTGTGKEEAAATIHALSHRRGRAFVAVNCGAVAASLVESEFFGHERGAFTGADKRRIGVFEQAHRGTLFLDEITEMPLELQVKLLRVLETRQVKPVGGSKAVTVDVRILVAANREPKAAVADGKLREDLMYRLCVFPIALPRLAARAGDIRMLAREFLARVNRERDAGKSFDEASLQRLESHSWPGNVRELANVCRRAFIMATDDRITVADLPFPRADDCAGTADRGSGATAMEIVPGMTIAAAEKLLIEATVADLAGNKRGAAKNLGISLKTLYSRLQVYAAESRRGD